MTFDWEEAPDIDLLGGELRGATMIDDLLVVRDDKLRGGSKSRFLHQLCRGHSEVVYGGPFCGGAPVALAVLGRDMGFRSTLFYAARKNPHPRQLQAIANGAKIVWVTPGYMNVVQKRAREYAEVAGAKFLPLGFDTEAAAGPFISVMKDVRSMVGTIDEVWCATGSGMLARCLGIAFPDSQVHGVTVGLKSRHEHQKYPVNVRLHGCDLKFEQEAEEAPPGWFSMCPNYDRKAFHEMLRSARGRVLFWNVMGESHDANREE